MLKTSVPNYTNPHTQTFSFVEILRNSVGISMITLNFKYLSTNISVAYYLLKQDSKREKRGHPECPEGISL